MTTRPPITGLAWVEDFEIVKKAGESEDRQVVNDGTWVRLTRLLCDGDFLRVSSGWLFETAVWDGSQCLVVHFHF